MIKYEGIFFDKDMVEIIKSFEENPLPIVNDEIHCTFKYKPDKDEIFNELVGKEFDVYLIGYGCNGENSGFKISLPKELSEYYINYDEDSITVLKTPHITMSLQEGAKASNTKNLEFKPLDTPIKITGRFGYWIESDDKEYLSFEPYNSIMKM